MLFGFLHSFEFDWIGSDRIDAEGWHETWSVGGFLRRLEMIMVYIQC